MADFHIKPVNLMQLILKEGKLRLNQENPYSFTSAEDLFGPFFNTLKDVCPSTWCVLRIIPKPILGLPDFRVDIEDRKLCLTEKTMSGIHVFELDAVQGTLLWNQKTVDSSFIYSFYQRLMGIGRFVEEGKAVILRRNV